MGDNQKKKMIIQRLEDRLGEQTAELWEARGKISDLMVELDIMTRDRQRAAEAYNRAQHEVNALRAEIKAARLRALVPEDNLVID